MNGLSKLQRVTALAVTFLLLVSSGCYTKIGMGQWAPREVVVLFTYEGTCNKVCLSGDFNGWAANSHCLSPKGERWEIRVKLQPGRYRYGFILDGTRWSPDQNALFQEDDGFGKRNSVLIVE
jgi:1,4-alpha-glucan branching enzyme